ncbi:unnamed protein product [Amoebophrya sp. A25]|nr:unnamed protein product [Amoebophrya sp. A25]|eukprot:GSA25T00024217001.1
MPRQGNKRKKTRTHIKPAGEADPNAALQEDKTPRCFVVRRGKIEKGLQELVQDFRYVCAPNSAIKLKESRMNKLRDFVNVASHFKVTHVNTFSQTKGASGGASTGDLTSRKTSSSASTAIAGGTCLFRVGRLPRGPTLSFVLREFTTVKDLKAAQKRPRSASAKEFNVAPLLLLNGMRLNYKQEDEQQEDDEEKKSSSANKAARNKAKALELIGTTLKNMFPAVDVNTFSTRNCKRVALFHYDHDKELLHFRHYAVAENRNAQVSRTVQKLLKPKFLKKKTDVASYIENRGDYDSDSDAGDSVVLEESAPLPTNKGSTSAGTVSVKLVEIGPRMTLQLQKGEEGFFEGSILFHEFVKKSAEEQAVIAKRLLDTQKRKDLKEAAIAETEAKKEEMRKKREAFENKKLEKVAKRIGGDDDEEEDEENEDAEDAGDKKTAAKRQKFNPFSFARKKSKGDRDDNTVEFGSNAAAGGGASSSAGAAGGGSSSGTKPTKKSGGGKARTTSAGSGKKGSSGAGGKGKGKGKKTSVMDKFKKATGGDSSAGGGKKGGGKGVQKKLGRKGRGREKARAADKS